MIGGWVEGELNPVLMSIIGLLFFAKLLKVDI